jgi:hypothetical protein
MILISDNGLQIGEGTNSVGIVQGIWAFAYVLLCSRCGFLAVNFNRSNVFCSFLWGGKNILLFSCVYHIYNVSLHKI